MTQLAARVVDPVVTIGTPISRTRFETVDHPPAVTEPPPARRTLGDRTLVAVEAVVTVTAGVAVGLLLDTGPATVVLATVGWLVLLASGGHHRRHGLGDSVGAAVVRVLVAGAKALVLAAASAPPLSRIVDHDLLWLAVAFILTSAVVALVSPVKAARVVVVGPPREVRDVLAELGSAGRHPVAAVCVTRRTRTGFGDVPGYVGLRSVTEAIARHAAEAVVVLPGSNVSQVELRRLQWELARSRTALYLGTALLDVAPRRTRLVTDSGLEVLHIAPAPLSGPRRILKDVVERSLAVLALVLLTPVLLALAVVVRRDSPGPALFQQERVGRDGRTFRMLKFRSMTVTAESDRTGLVASNESDGGVLFKIQQDPRVTRAGRWLRRYSLDELPQLWNVVRGDMSLVGPRPALPQEVAQYDVDPLRRLVVKPGVTGLWQVSGRSDLSWDESVRLDLRYVDNWSLSLDLAILVRTVRAVLGHRGAY